MIKAVLSDFDGTLVTRDILDVVCGIVGKAEASQRLNTEFMAGHRGGRATLIERINHLHGVTLTQIKDTLHKNPYLMDGATEWIQYLKSAGISIILYSGNIEPILQYYQQMLGIDYIVGTKPRLEHDTIVGISPADFPASNWKLAGIKTVLTKLAIKSEETLAIGDSPADKEIFAFAGTSVAINPKHGIEKAADFVIQHDLRAAIPIVKACNNT